MKLAIIDYNAGNTRSVMNALYRERVNAVLSSDEEVILSADKVILPGVGHAGEAMRILNEKGLVDVIRRIEKPLLGVCLGMQLMMEFSEEADTPCLGLVKGSVKLFPNNEVKVPQIGWNSLSGLKSPLFDGIDEEEYFYFVHSYYVPMDETYTIAECDYGLKYSAAIQFRNFYGTQFHPEKSSTAGERILQNFLKL